MIALVQDEVESLKAQIATMQAELDRLRAIAHIDQLTQIPNRRSFDEALEREWGRSARTGEPLSLLAIDIDHFKRFNDQFGHLAGDKVLKQVATAIASIPSRPADLVARTGGEEFAVLLPNTSRKGAEAIAALVLDAVQAVGAGVSIGVATLSALPFLQSESLVESADQALYAAKRQGRNRFIIAEV